MHESYSVSRPTGVVNRPGFELTHGRHILEAGKASHRFKRNSTLTAPNMDFPDSARPFHLFFLIIE
jgi:hypothetical protein